MKQSTGGPSTERAVLMLYAEHVALGRPSGAGGPHHSVDAEGRLRPRRGEKGPDVVYLGDVATALIHGLQEAATLTMTRPPKFDEQRWELEVKTGDMTVRIHSRPYWGFGLVTKGP